MADGAVLSEANQNYLKLIYHLQNNHSRVLPKDISEQMKVSFASVTSMLKKLAEKDLIEYTPYKKIALTPAGEKLALEMVRHHRLIELFLSKVLGYRIDQVHEEAERLEHSLSEDLERRIDDFLGYPDIDPHGSPIPSEGGWFEKRHSIRLSEATGGFLYSVSQLLSRDSGKLRYLAKMGILPGVGMKILEKKPYHGPIHLWLDSGTEPIIGHELAEEILLMNPSLETAS